MGGEDDDSISGGDSDDVLYGNGGDNKLYGEDDNDLIVDAALDHDGQDNVDDFLFSAKEKDTLISNFGDDTISGGAGRDKFYITYYVDSESGRGLTIDEFSRK